MNDRHRKDYKIQKYINKLQRASLDTHHETMEDAADRKFIREYVKSCIPYVCDQPEILEFDGGVVYADEIIRQKGGNVEFATEKGRLERNNPITYEFDLNHEIIEKKFDLIIATQILGGFINPVEILKKLCSMLKRDGIIIITVSGPAYPRVKGQITFYSKEGLVKIGRSVVGASNVKNVRSYGDFASAICMLNYLRGSIGFDQKDYFDYKHEVINAIICVNRRN